MEMEFEEDVTPVVLWNFLQLTDKKVEREHWVHPLNKQRKVNKFINELRAYPAKFYNYCRMTISTFDYLCDLIQAKIRKRNSITPEERLFITLRFLATGERFQYLHYNLRVGATTAEKIISETCSAIWEVLAPIYLMSNPTPEKWTTIAERFEELWNYPNCCGAIDGKHIRIEAPWNCGSAFYNYKNYHSIVLQAVVDADGKFIIVDVGEAGRNNDSGVFLSSSFGISFNTQKLKLPKPRQLDLNNPTKFPYVFVGDEAYGIHKHFMKPFSRKALTNERKIDNYRHSRARRIVECAFGMMAKKFRVFEHAMLVHPDVTKKIVLACCALHNMIRVRKRRLSDVFDEIINIEEYDEDIINSRQRAAKAAYKVREDFVTYFISPEGSVPWQEKMAFC